MCNLAKPTKNFKIKILVILVSIKVSGPNHVFQKKQGKTAPISKKRGGGQTTINRKQL